MANTLHSLFPFSEVPLKSALVYPREVYFSAPIVAGHYVFDDDRTPPQSFGDLIQDNTGVIAGIMIGANCSPDDFAANVVDSLKIQVYHGGNRTPINLSPFPFSHFAHGDNYSLWWNITSSGSLDYGDEFYMSINGRVKQIANMTENELRLKIAFNYWQVDKKDLK